MRLKKTHVIYVCLAILIIMTTLFIFINSAMNLKDSSILSDKVVEMVVPFDNHSHESISFYVRKLAHLFEYAMLAIAVMGLANYYRSQQNKSIYGFSLFYILAISVLDEHIQSFSDRTSYTGDILLDFAGAMIGMLAAFFVVFVIKCIKKRQKIT